MSMQSTLQTGLSGLLANSRTVGTISENIANANTVGYRRNFNHMVTRNAVGSIGETSGSMSVTTTDQVDMMTSGSLITTNSPTDLAIGGPGFFAVSLNPNETNQANYFLTRAGSFLPDANGDLRNAAGYYLAGFPYGLDGTVGTLDRSSFDQMRTVNLGDVTISAGVTGNMSAAGNLPSTETGLTTPGAPYATSAWLYTPLGETQRLGLSWQATATDNVWELSVSDPDENPLGTVTVTFDDSGPLAGSPLTYTGATSTATAPADFAFDATTGIATITLDNGAVPQEIELSLGAPGSFDGITQFAGDFSLTFDRDGSSVGQLTRSEVGADGTLYGIFSNGMRRPLFEVPITVVDNPNGLIEVNGNAYMLTDSSGNFSALRAGSGNAGSLNGGALEASNVDIVQEMTDLIKAQRAFSSNAKVITTTDELMDEITRLKR